MSGPAPSATCVRLPAALHTLAALRLPALLDDAGTADCSAIEEIGLAALQWLAHARTGCGLVLANPSPAFIAAARTGGFAGLLLDETPPERHGRRTTIRFADAALRFGREPLLALATLGRAGAILTARLRAAGAAPDEIAVDIAVALPGGVGDAEVADALGAFEDAYTLIDEGTPASPPAFAAHQTAPADGITVAQEKLDRLMALADELASAQAALAQALGPQRIAVSAEIGEVDRLWRILQSAIADLGAAPLGDLLGLPAGGWRWEGPPLEIERAVIDRVAPPLRAAIAAPGAGGIVSAIRDGSFALVSLAPAPGDAAAIVAAAAAVGGRAEAVGGTLAIRLPRSLSLVDALVIEVGAGCYALPVTHMVEALRPDAAALRHVGPGRALLRFGGGYVPVVAVGAAFDVAGWEADPARAVLIVVETARGRVALLVDAIVDQQQVTVKPVDGGIGRPRGTLGAAIVRGNRVALVIDVDGLAG